MDRALDQVYKNLESIKKVTTDGFEFWSARELKDVLGYKEWRKFSEVIEKAKKSSDMSNQNAQDHFVGADKMVLTGSGASRKVEDVLLTRLACSLILMNGDVRKSEIALAQLYFATQTRKQEMLEERDQENRRLESREKLKETEKKIQSTVYTRGIKLPVEFGTFKNRHIESLYGGISIRDLKNKKSIPQSRALADFDTEVELKAKDFILAMTDHNIKEKNLKGVHEMTQEVVKNSKATRQTLISRNIIPENLKAQEDLKKVEARRKQELKRVAKKLK